MPPSGFSSSSPIRIRRAGRADLSAILRIERASFTDEAWDRELFAAYLHDHPELFIVATLDGRVVGYMITCVARHRVAEIASIAVHPESRGRRIARTMLLHTAIRLRVRGVRSWWLMVRPVNTPAIRLYRAAGFRRQAMVRGYYHDGGSAWRMAAAL
jgi:[ribosomal protein S18]-alanine N-acetyltransferase